MAKKINIRNICDASVRCHGSGFRLDIVALNRNDEHCDYSLHFNGAWWVKTLAKLLWKVVQFERREFNAIVDSLKEEQS